MRYDLEEKHLDAFLIALLSFAVVVLTLGATRIIVGFP